MGSLWLRLLGKDPSSIPPDAKLEFFFTDALHSWLWFVLIAVVIAVVFGVFYIYRDEIKTCPKPVKIFLGCVRALVLLILALILLGPALGVSLRSTNQPILVILLDESPSTTMPDFYTTDPAVEPVVNLLHKTRDEVRAQRPTRLALMSHLFESDDHKLLRDLVAKSRVRIVTFDSTPKPGIEIREAADRNQATPPPADPNNPRTARPETIEGIADFRLLPPSTPGAGTNYIRAIREELQRPRSGGAPLAGIVLVSDGQQTDRSETLDSVIELAKNNHVPIFTVGVGDPSKARNVRVVGLKSPEFIWKGDPAELVADIETSGLGAEKINVELRGKSLGDGSTAPDASEFTLIESKPVQVTPDQPSFPVKFALKPDKEGKILYQVVVVPVENEWPDDNSKQEYVTVLSKQAKVLLVAGTPNFDYQNLRSLLLREKTIELQCWLQSADSTVAQEASIIKDDLGNVIKEVPPLAKLPATAEELLKYDVILMLDPDPRPQLRPSEMDKNWMELLKRFLKEHSGGVLYMAGPAFTARFMNPVNPSNAVRDLLPVRFQDVEGQVGRAMLIEYDHELPLQLGRDGDANAIMRFGAGPADDEQSKRETRENWDNMPGVYWSYPTKEAKPGAGQLLEIPSLDSRPLIVTGQFGAGRTVYLGFTGTWRWRRVGKDAEYFDKFWIQSIRYLIQGRYLGSRRGEIRPEGKDRFAPEESISVTIRLFDKQFNPLKLDKVPVKLRLGNQVMRTFDATPIANREGYYQGAVKAPPSPGVYEFIVTLPNEGDDVVPARRIEIAAPQEEFKDTSLDRPQLRRLAEQTEGRYFEIDEARASLAGAIPDRAERRVTPLKPIELWDNKILLILLAGLLSLEWATRKYYKLM